MGDALALAAAKFAGIRSCGFKRDSYDRLLTTVQRLGFLIRKGADCFVAAIPRADNAFLILLHARLAPTPRIVRMPDTLDATC